MGLGVRHVPLDGQPVENPGVGEYDIRIPPYPEDPALPRDKL